VISRGRVVAYALILFLVISFLFYRTFLGDITARALVQISPHSALIGDTVRYSIKVVCQKDCEIDFSEIKKTMHLFDVRVGKVSKHIVFNRKKTVCDFFLIAYRPGDYRILGGDLFCTLLGSKERKKIAMDEKVIRIKSLVREDLEKKRTIGINANMTHGGLPVRFSTEGGQVASMKAPIRYPIKDTKGLRKVRATMDYVFILFYLVAGMAGMMVLAWIVIAVLTGLKRKHRSAYENARSKLCELQSEKLLEKDKTKEFCISILSIFKEYLLFRFALGTPGMTAGEFVEAIDRMKDINPGDKKFLIDKIKLWERVKYSRYSLPNVTFDPELKDELDFLKRTKQVDDEE